VTVLAGSTVRVTGVAKNTVIKLLFPVPRQVAYDERVRDFSAY
jgi:hypothetical protein